MASLDEISLAIGRLEARSEHQERATQQIARGVTEISNGVRDLQEVVKDVVTDVGVMKPHVQHYAGVRRFAGIVVSGVAGCSAALGAVAAKAAEKLGWT